MNLPRPNKKLEALIQQSIKKMLCPVHNKAATITMPSENEEVLVEACCSFFKKDIMLIGERMRKDFLYKEEKTRERIEKQKRREQ